MLLKSAAQKHQFQELVLGTADKLEGTRRFYQKMGFETVSPTFFPRSFERCVLDTRFYQISVPALLNTLL